MTYDVLGIIANYITAIGTVTIPLVLLLIGFRHKKKRKKEKVIEICAYEFLTSFIIPFYSLYDYFFQYTDENANGSLIIAMEKLKEKRIFEVRNVLLDNELGWKFPFFEKHIADIGENFPEKLSIIYNFVRRARMLGQMQQTIIEELNQKDVIANETTVSSEEKNKQEETDGTDKADGSGNMVDMKDYLKKVDNKNIQLALAQIKKLKDAIEMLPDEMEIENKRQCMKKQI